MNNIFDGEKQERLILSDIDKSFSKTPVLKKFNIQVNNGEIIGVMGPSGCGKSTLLRLIAGLEQPDQGEIYLDNVLISNAHYRLAPEKRRMGMIFQSLALWPHLTVADHLAYGISDRPKVERSNKIDELLNLLRLTEKRQRFPHQLSGGEQQRVALGRALIVKPHLLLCDEPLNSLDRELRIEVRDFLYKIVRESEITTIFVSHDPEDLVSADRVIRLTPN